MKKILMVLFVVFMSSMIVLAACSNRDDSNGESAKADSGNTENAKATGLAKPGELPIVQEKAEIHVVARRTPLAPSDYSNIEIAKKVESMTNVHVKWETIVETDFNEKKNLLFATDSLPEVFWNGSFSDTELIKYGKDGSILVLNDLIDHHMPNLKKIFEERPDIKVLATAPDGNIYSLPTGEELGSGQESIGSNPDFLYINQKWLDKLNLKMPTTIEEFRDVLVAFKTQDPNGNGKADEIPLSYMNNYWTGDIGYLFGVFGEPDKIDHIGVKNGKVYYIPLTNEYKEALKYFHAWFEEGLVDIESFTHDVSGYLAKGKTEEETLGSFLWWDKTDVVGNERDDHYRIVPPFKDMVVKYNNGGSGIGRGSIVITKNAKNPELVAQWLDVFFDPEMAAQARWGAIGEWFAEERKNGLLVQKSSISNPGEFRHQTSLNGIGIITADHFENLVAPEPRAKKRMDDIKNIFVPHMQNEKYPDIFFTEDELEIIEKLKTEIQTYTNNMRAKFLLKGNIDEQWNEYVNALKNMGIDQLIEVYQVGYDRYQAAQ